MRIYPTLARYARQRSRGTRGSHAAVAGAETPRSRINRVALSTFRGPTSRVVISLESPSKAVQVQISPSLVVP